MTLTKHSLKVILATIALCVVAALSFVGCSAAPLQIGNTSDSSISMTNKTGQAITAVAVKSDSDPAFGEALSQNGDWKNDAVAEVHYPEITTETITEPSADQLDIVINNLQSLQITTADGMTYTLHQLNLDDIKDATLYVDGEIAYLEYTSVETGETVSTQGAEEAYLEEIAAAEAAELKAQEELAAKQAAEKAEAEKAAANSNTETKKSSSTQNSNSSSTSNKTSSNSSSNNSSSNKEDACVDDLVLN